MITIKAKNKSAEQLLANDLSKYKNIEVSIVEEVEDIEDKKLPELVDDWINLTKNYRFEGPNALESFEKLVKIIGYEDIDDFFSDNSGCFETMIEWIKNSHVKEWEDELRVWVISNSKD